MAPCPRVVKPARPFATRCARKVQGLSNLCPHFELFSMGRNKPYGEISHSPMPRPPQPPVTHTVCGPGCRRLVRPHTSRPRSLKNELHMHSSGEGAHRPPWCARSLVRAVTKTLRRWCENNNFFLSSSLSRKKASRPPIVSIFMAQPSVQ